MSTTQIVGLWVKFGLPNLLGDTVCLLGPSDILHMFWAQNFSKQLGLMFGLNNFGPKGNPQTIWPTLQFPS